tara:strand:- start:52 stop:546 length:495 start_codon:yes stop_codon:yes gene_type:complete
MKQKGFTLIELLVVVAIIGILAAVGVVAYSGYTSSAKKTVVKNQHSEIVKFIRLEKTKCETIFSHQKLVTASGGNYEPPCSDFLNISQMSNSVYKMSQHLIGIGFKNPVEPTKPFHQYSGDYCSATMGFAFGCSEITGSGGIMTIKTCASPNCTQTLTATINFN